MYGKSRLLITAVFLLTSCAHQPPPDPKPSPATVTGPDLTQSEAPEPAVPDTQPAVPDTQPADETLARLRAYVEFSRGEVVHDEQLAAEAEKLYRTIDDRQLPAVEQFALSDEAKPVAWVLIYLLVDRGQMDAAAHVIVHDLRTRPENRRYGMWKWWEYRFGERTDYMDMSRRIGESLLRQFETGTPEDKLVVAELFGKGPEEAKLTVDEFKTAIRFDARQ